LRPALRYAKRPRWAPCAGSALRFAGGLEQNGARDFSSSGREALMMAQRFPTDFLPLPRRLFLPVRPDVGSPHHSSYMPSAIQESAHPHLARPFVCVDDPLVKALLPRYQESAHARRAHAANRFGSRRVHKLGSQTGRRRGQIDFRIYRPAHTASSSLLEHHERSRASFLPWSVTGGQPNRRGALVHWSSGQQGGSANATRFTGELEETGASEPARSRALLDCWNGGHDRIGRRRYLCRSLSSLALMGARELVAPPVGWRAGRHMT
jgi:hypothetical protein